MDSFLYPVLGYHGCDKALADDIVGKRVEFGQSTNEYDWLGDGTYFWIGSYNRALDWAQFKQSRGEITTPAVLCAAIELGNCLNLTDLGVSARLSTSYEAMKAELALNGRSVPENSTRLRHGIPLFRNRDCAVIRYHHKEWADQGHPPYDTVLGAFEEGPPAFDGAAIRERSHIQLAVRTTSCIRTVFQLV